MGYTAENDQDYWSWNKKDNKQYALLLIVIAIIFFTTAILFNSLKQPLAIIFVIPISYLGHISTINSLFQASFSAKTYSVSHLPNEYPTICNSAPVLPASLNLPLVLTLN